MQLEVALTNMMVTANMHFWLWLLGIETVETLIWLPKRHLTLNFEKGGGIFMWSWQVLHWATVESSAVGRLVLSTCDPIQLRNRNFWLFLFIIERMNQYPLLTYRVHLKRSVQCQHGPRRQLTSQFSVVKEVFGVMPLFKKKCSYHGNSKCRLRLRINGGMSVNFLENHS